MPREAEAPSAVKVLMRIPDLSQPKGSRLAAVASQPAARAPASPPISMALPLAYLDDIAPAAPAAAAKTWSKSPPERPHEPAAEASDRDWSIFAADEHEPSSRVELTNNKAGETTFLDAAEAPPAPLRLADLPLEPAKPGPKPHVKSKYQPDPEEIVSPDERKRQSSQPLVLLGALAIIVCVLVVALVRNRNARQEHPAVSRPAAPSKVTKPHDTKSATASAGTSLPVTVTPPARAPAESVSGPSLAPPQEVSPAEITIERLPPVPQEIPAANEARGAVPDPGVARLENRIDKTPTDGNHDAPRRRLY